MSGSPSSPLQLRSSADTAGEVARVLAKLEASGRNLPIVRAVANWEQGFRPFILMADALLTKGELDPVVREIVVLDLAKQQELEYEWAEHEPMALRAGVSPAQISAIAQRQPVSSDVFPEEATTAVELARTVLNGRRIPDGLWQRAADMLGETAAIELIFAVAWWGGFVPAVIRSLLPLVGVETEAEGRDSSL